MKRLITFVILIAVASVMSCQKVQKAEEKALTKQDLDGNAKSKQSYALGLDVSTNFKSRGLELDNKFFIEGFKAGLGETAALITDEEKTAALTELQNEMMKKMQEEMTKKSTENKAKGLKFLEENKAKPGIKVTASGLQYKVDKEGTGPNPKAEDMVTVHYKGTLLDGTEFDSSYKRNEPAKFPLNRVIKGWTEGVQLMNKGAKYTFYIPSDLAYGDYGSQNIGPGETLIFEVELISFENAPAEKTEKK
ncbi:MAG TPA: FKBP-type peptidyl-prolyl cis-trans isomerase [bacterium]|nr:FKBP-type peptidyl-prolyl cis-trans isomerase [bacterium]HPS30529.1 FKBP-type peptidyl-prolyl cis-trans isomerase [bacterium]